MFKARLSAYMLICHKGHTDTIQVYSVTVMTHVKALQAGHSSQGTSEPITPGYFGITWIQNTKQNIIKQALPCISENIMCKHANTISVYLNSG